MEFLKNYARQINYGPQYLVFTLFVIIVVVIIILLYKRKFQLLIIFLLLSFLILLGFFLITESNLILVSDFVENYRKFLIPKIFVLLVSIIIINANLWLKKKHYNAANYLIVIQLLLVSFYYFFTKISTVTWLDGIMFSIFCFGLVNTVNWINLDLANFITKNFKLDRTKVYARLSKYPRLNKLIYLRQWVILYICSFNFKTTYGMVIFSIIVNIIAITLMCNYHCWLLSSITMTIASAMVYCDTIVLNLREDLVFRNNFFSVQKEVQRDLVRFRTSLFFNKNYSNIRGYSYWIRASMSNLGELAISRPPSKQMAKLLLGTFGGCAVGAVATTMFHEHQQTERLRISCDHEKFKMELEHERFKIESDLRRKELELNSKRRWF